MPFPHLFFFVDIHYLLWSMKTSYWLFENVHQPPWTNGNGWTRWTLQSWRKRNATPSKRRRGRSTGTCTRRWGSSLTKTRKSTTRWKRWASVPRPFGKLSATRTRPSTSARRRYTSCTGWSGERYPRYDEFMAFFFFVPVAHVLDFERRCPATRSARQPHVQRS